VEINPLRATPASFLGRWVFFVFYGFVGAEGSPSASGTFLDQDFQLREIGNLSLILFSAVSKAAKLVAYYTTLPYTTRVGRDGWGDVSSPLLLLLFLLLLGSALAPPRLTWQLPSRPLPSTPKKQSLPVAGIAAFPCALAHRERKEGV